MSLAIDVYGTLIRLPENKSSIQVETWDTDDPKEQYWRRRELPDCFDKVQYDADENAILTPEQKQYALEEVRRCKEGFYFMNEGVLTYITGKHYFYLQWWTLEDQIHPDYRDTDRRYFLFLDYWEHILWCLGIARGKKRREGASSQATSNLIYECIFFTNSNCGLVSKSKDDSRDTFTDMARNGYNQLPVFLKPRQLNRADSVTELVFAAKMVKGEAADGGMKSKINYRAPVLNAYDRGRISRGLFDEGGKWPIDIPFSKFMAIVTKTMVKGAKRVGFAECPSTVNEMTKGGGAEYKKFWDGANQFKRAGKPTTNRFVTYFTSAYDGYEGFIDKYGMSVIDEPTDEQYEFLVNKWVKQDPITGDIISELSEEDIKLGAKAYVIGRRKDLTGDLLEEEIRMNPCTVQEMFEAANTDCAFNSYEINKRIKELEEHPIYKRKILFYRDESQIVHFRDVDEKKNSFYWKITAFPPKGEENKYKLDGRIRRPGRVDDGAIAVDSYSNSQGGRKYGSKASAWIGRKGDVNDPENTNKAIGHLYGRPQVKEILHDQVMMACEYYGYQAWYEHTADDYLSHFRERGKIGYLGTYPINLIDPNKRNEAEKYKGTPITPFSLTKQLDNGIAYFNDHCDKIDFEELLENAKIFDPYDRTAYDCVVAFLILISCLMQTVNKPKPRSFPLVTLYENEHYGQAVS